MRKPTFFRKFIWVLSLPLVLGACGPMIAVGPPTAEDVAGVGQGKRSIVLFRYTATRDSEPYKDLEPFWLRYANIDKGEKPPLVSEVSSPSPEAREAGWFYAVLDPGTHYLLILPPGSQQNPPAIVYHTDTARYGRLSSGELRIRGRTFWYPGMQFFLINGTPPADFAPIPGFWFHVPAGEPVVYVGSASVACGTIPGLLGRLTDSCMPFEVADETSAARAIAERAFAGHGVLSTRMMAHLGRPNRTVPRRALFPMGLRTRLAATGTEPGVTGAEPGPTFLVPGTGVFAGAPGQAIGVFNLLLLLGQATAVAQEDAAARERAEQWAPCLKDLTARLPFAEVAAEIPAALNAALENAGGTPAAILDAGQGSASGIATVLDARFLGAGLRECTDQGALCVEVSMRVRLAAADNNPVYDSVLIYSNAYRSDPVETAYRLYHVATPETSPCRAIETYCGAGGVDVVRREISAGIRAIAAEAARSLLAQPAAARP